MNSYNISNLEGKRFGGVVVQGEGKKDKYDNQTVILLCDCGNVFTTRLQSIKKLNPIKSCSTCRSKRTVILAQAATRIHGEAQKTKLHGVWAAMKRRCYNKKDSHYDRYGGRGIIVCDEWKEYINFRDWALLNGYKEGLTLDRADNDKNYTPKNCRWETIQYQQTHRCNTISIIDSAKRRISMIQLSEISGINISTLYERRRKNKNISFTELIAPVNV